MSPIARLHTDRRIFDARAAGALCDECPLKFRQPVGPEENAGALAILGESPGPQEDKIGSPFVGKSGDKLNKWLAEFGLSRSQVHITNAVLCKPKEHMRPDEWKASLAACAPRLQAELDRHDERKAICAFGGKALQALTGRSKVTPWAGGPILSEELHSVIIPSFHPAFALRKPAYLPVVKWYLARAVAFAYGRLSQWQWPRLVTEPPYEATLEELSHEEELSLDIENAPRSGRIRCVGLGSQSLAVSIPLPPEGQATDRELSLLRDILANPRITKILQNGQHDRWTLESKGTRVVGPFWDTLLAHNVIAPRLPHDLGFIASIETHAPRWKTEFHVEGDDKEQRGSFWDKVELNALLTYNAKDNVQQANIKQTLAKKLDTTHNGWALFHELSQLDEIAYRMRKRGLLVNNANREKHRSTMTTELNRLGEEFRKLVSDVNVTLGANGCHRSLGKFFFEQLKAPVVATSEQTGGPSLNVTALNYYVGFFSTQGAPHLAQLCRVILKYRQLSKLLSSYIETLPVGEDGAVHPWWKPGKARTGRWAAREPALNTMPKPKLKKLPDGTKEVVKTGLRDLFEAHPGFSFVKADYSQLELRVMATLSGDPAMLQAYAEGKDLHQMVADEIFGKGAPKAARDRCKNVNYGLLYGGSDETIWKTLVIDMPDIKQEMVAKVRQTFFGIFNRAAKWQEELIEIAKDCCFVEAPLSGRRQYYHDGEIVPTEIKNFPIQATAGDLANRAIIAIDKMVDWKTSFIVTQVHDEIMLEVQDVEFGVQSLKAGMEQEVELNGCRMKFPVEISTGTNWGSLKEVK